MKSNNTSRPSPNRRSKSRTSQVNGMAGPSPHGPQGPPIGPPMGPPMMMNGIYGTLPPPPPQGPPPPFMMGPPHFNGRVREPEAEEPTPICRCRVLYLGSAVPHVTKDGLQGIQEPLKDLYPEEGAKGAEGIDSWLSVWSNGFLLENVDENRKKVTRFFPVESLHYCAAVRYVQVPGSAGQEKVQRFLPLDSPFARNPNMNHPPLFAAILRRTTGIKVLECHVFICKRETAANALVRCSFHSYADFTYAKHLESGGQSIYGTLGGPTPIPSSTPTPGANGVGVSMVARPEMSREYQQSVIEVSEDSINSIEKVEEWNGQNGGSGSSRAADDSRHHHLNLVPNGTSSPRENGNNSTSPDNLSVFDDYHKVWTGKTPEPTENIYGDYGSTMRSFRSNASGLSTRNNRPRQLAMPSSPPPPPIPEELGSKDEKGPKDASGKGKRKKRSKSRETVDNGVPRSNSSVINGPKGPGSLLGGRKQSAASLMGIPPRMNGHARMPPHGPPPMMMMPMPNGKSGKKAGTFSARQKKNMAQPIPPFMMMAPGPYGPYGIPPPHLMPPPGHPIYAAGMMPQPGGSQVEEPIYMPHNARPISPVASYQPGHFPHEAYYNQQQYATIDKSNRYRKNKGVKREENGKKSNKNHQSSDSNAEDSEFGAGLIYKKGHINERAFSYSIRNEQRSRSFGSLSNMQFGPNGEHLGPPNGHGPPNGLDEPDRVNGGRKEQEFIQMMSELELGEDHIERSEVPPGLYPPPMFPGGPPHPHMMMAPHPMMGNGAPTVGRKKR